jgi:pimeloyl-ACP methyl ester carboxylesterase
LFDSRFKGESNQYDPQFRGACDLYNGSLEAALRLVCAKDGLKPGQNYTIETASGTWDIEVKIRGGRWRNEDFDHFEFVSDYDIKGLTNHYHSYGLGVPLIAVRNSYPGEPAEARYYPIDLSFPVTVLMRPQGDLLSQNRKDQSVHRKAVLEIYDPLTVKDIAIEQHRVPLESDLSTPLAYFLSKPELEQLATVGLLQPDELLKKLRPGKTDPIMGLYMMQPYEPGKIPVLMVHGLWSSPITWMEMYNDLCNSPEIRDRYQFWFYLYPTGQPFWNSAAQMRADLAEARKILDPNGQEPSLDQMVLIGHSMGGLVSHLQTIDSGNDYWQLVSDEPLENMKAEDDVRQKMRDCFYFRPNPSIRRVVTIGTPHRGSKFSNNVTQWLTSKLITMPSAIAESTDRLFAQNKRKLPSNSILTIRTSIDSLSPDSPMFDTMLASKRPPWVKYHNVVGVVPDKGLFGRIAAGTDGVVARRSAHLDKAESEITVSADHTTVHAHPKTVLEVRRVLLEHLAELDNFPTHGNSPSHIARLPDNDVQVR